jgi:multidrug efflux pump subunit AcrB
MAVPALLLSAGGRPVNAASACAFVAVCGMAINASVLTVDEIRRALKERINTDGCTDSNARGPSPLLFYRALRRESATLLATSLTTIAGAIPFLFLREGSNLVLRTLSLVTACGVAASCLLSLTLVPALCSRFDLSDSPGSPRRSRCRC